MPSFFKNKKTKTQTTIDSSSSKPSNGKQDETTLTFEIDKNVQLIKDCMGNPPDLNVRKIIIDASSDFSIAMIRMDGMSDKKEVDFSVIEPLSKLNFQELREQLDNPNSAEVLGRLIAVNKLEKMNNLEKVVKSILQGNTAILFSHTQQIFLASTRLIDKRGLSEPTSQTVIRGPKDSFTEDLRTNTSLVRARITNPKLRIETLNAGEITHTNIELMYLKGIANDSILQEVRSRIKKIKIDAILESSYIEEFIQDSKNSIFPTLISTERPDVVVANLLEGRFAIFVYGTPYVLIGPATFIQFFQSPEDYYQNYYMGSFIRILRFVAFFIALYIPGLYVAIMTHHHALIPTTLLITLAGQREGVPFPIVVEALIMELVFEVLREAGVRMPRAVGQTVSIVGALILGQAAVEAGFVSASTVIVVSLTAIANFTMPFFNVAIAARILRFFLLLLGSFIGMYGILLGTFMILAHLCSLRSFGLPYFDPITPFKLLEQKDVFIRLPLPKQRTRPQPARPEQKFRVKRGGSQNET
ncbi:spore germination protein KA [Peribacillus deserti]|uniref:Spore germination protein KA n=1 Tax=Peribacillus deserti TaxID=673318 RepID=A0ABS2QL65_9BACI|nr:spore germination protein [Peribacillus deserti]MBM7693700.1 spore germination protein KA [Peribacillus deserti]